MPLDKATLISDIKNIHNSMKTKVDNQQSNIDNYAEQLANAIDKYVKSGDVNTVGSATAQTGKLT